LNFFKDIFYVYLEKSVKILNIVLVVNLNWALGLFICVCVCFKWPGVSNVHQNKREIAKV